jgi:hypothetical protein
LFYGADQVASQIVRLNLPPAQSNNEELPVLLSSTGIDLYLWPFRGWLVRKLFCKTDIHSAMKIFHTNKITVAK